MSDLREAAQQALEALYEETAWFGPTPKGAAAIAALKAALAQQAEPVQEQDVEDAIEAAYWHFDARKKGLNEWAYAPQSERDAFKAEARKLVRGYFPTRQAQDTKREMLAVADAFIRGKRAALAQQNEPVQEPVAWMLTDADNQRVKFLEWQKEPRNYSGAWIKTPLYTAPPRCPNCASLEAQNTELDRKLLAELEQAYEAVYRAGQAHEREECAKLCEARFVGDLNREDMEARRCAAAIRARGNT